MDFSTDDLEKSSLCCEADMDKFKNCLRKEHGLEDSEFIDMLSDYLLDRLSYYKSFHFFKK